MTRKYRFQLQSLDEIDSTNAFLLKKAPEFSDWYTVCTQKQTGGYGRFGRQWRMEGGADLAFSTIVPISSEIREFLPNLTQVTALAIRDLLQKQGIVSEIKWPNDVLVSGRKISGILLEGVTQGASIRVVAGIGLNVNSCRKDDLTLSATSMKDECGVSFSLDQILHEFMEFYMYWFEDLKIHGLLRIVSELNSCLAYRGCKKTIIDGTRKITGTVFGVDSHGALLLDVEGSVQSFYSGEISFEKSTE